MVTKNNKVKQIFIASDHGGFKVKEKLFTFLYKKKYSIADLGPHTLNPHDDYPDYAKKVAQKVAKEKNSFGILLCRNGQGICMAANKIKGTRAVTGFSTKMIKSTRQDDDANILCLPSDYLTLREIKKIVTLWLETPFSNLARHKRRIAKVKKLQQ